jgi:multidrug efflux pump subunit AcrB
MIYFLPADIVSQTLNFGLPAPFDIQVVGRNPKQPRPRRASWRMKSKKFPARWMSACNQPNNWPQFTHRGDGSKAAELGMTEADVANSVLLGLSGSSQVQPVYWLDPAVGIQYLINVRAPQYAIDSVQQLNAMPISAGVGPGCAQILANVATIKRVEVPPVVSHYNVLPVVDVYGNVDGRDLGGVLSDIQPLVEES